MGGGLGGLLGGGGGGKTTSSVTIPKWLKPIVKPLYEQSARIGTQIGNQAYSKYGGQRVADINSGMQNAITGLSNSPNSAAYRNAGALGSRMASGGFNNQANYGAGKQLTGDTLSGKYINNNPYLQDVINSTSRGVTDNFSKTMRPQMDANMQRQNAFGGSGWQQSNNDMNASLAQQLADSEGQMRYNNYATERGYQNQAINDAMAQQDFENQTQLAGANLGLSSQGQQDTAYQNALSANDIYRQRDQAQMDINNADFNEERDWLFRALQGVQGGLGSSSQLYGRSGKGGGGGSQGLIGTLGSLGQAYSAFGG
jgi:hypothetical protein